MPFTFSGSIGGALTPGSTGTSTSIVQNPRLVVVAVNQADGLTHTLFDVLNVNIVYGYDVGVSSATIECSEIPNFGGLHPTLSNYSQIRIYTDAGTPGRVWPPGTLVSTDGRNIPLRFTGLYLRTEATLNPHVFSLVCRGNLYLAQQFTQSIYAGLPVTEVLSTAQANVLQYTIIGERLTDLLNGAAATDQNIVLAILQAVVPAITVVPGDIGGTGRLFGSANSRQFAWATYRTALDMIQQWDQVCLGYRTFETLAGRIVRTQVFGYPGNIDTTFTEGADIWEGTGSRTVEPLINASYVEGATVPNARNGLVYGFLQASNPFQPVPVIEQFSSAWIEGWSTTTASDPAGVSAPGGILNPIDVAIWRLAERNRELVNVRFVTFRDDLLMPGHTIGVIAPHMALTEPMWLQHVELRVTANPVLWQQTLYCVGGGLPTGYIDPVTLTQITPVPVY